MGLRAPDPTDRLKRSVDAADALGREHPRVCILTETYFPVIGGGETQARALADGLAERGWIVTVLTRRTDDSQLRTEAYGAVEVRRLPPVGPHHLKKWGLLLTASWALFRLREQYDAVIVSGFRILGVPGAIACRCWGKACILKADSLGEMSGDYFTAGLAKLGLGPRSLPFRLFLAFRNRLLRRSDRFVAISSVIASELASGGISSAKIMRIPNSVDTERFKPLASPYEKRDLRVRLGLPADATIVIYTGRLVSYKGLPLLLRAWRRIYSDRRDAILFLVGAGGLDIHSCEQELREFARRHRLSESICFTGEVTNVHEYLQAADIFALPTENEAFGISLIEAMATRLPVISTRVGGVTDILRHEQNGLLVDAGDELQLRDALSRLLQDTELAASLAAAARRDAVEKYSAEQVVERYATLVEDVLEATRHLNRRQKKPSTRSGQ
jgi:glycosyltransferase involved in cell wall biosynthesis